MGVQKRGTVDRCGAGGGVPNGRGDQEASGGGVRDGGGDGRVTKLQARRIYGVRYLRGRYAAFFFLHMLLSSMPYYASLYAPSTYAYNLLCCSDRAVLAYSQLASGSQSVAFRSGLLLH